MDSSETAHLHELLASASLACDAILQQSQTAAPPQGGHPSSHQQQQMGSSQQQPFWVTPRNHPSSGDYSANSVSDTNESGLALPGPALGMVYAGSAARIHQPEPRKAGPHGRGSKDITLPQVERYYNQPLAQAARGLGLSATMLKKVCRSLGVRNWPYRQLASIDKTLAQLHRRLNAKAASGGGDGMLTRGRGASSDAHGTASEITARIQVLEARKVTLCQETSRGATRAIIRRICEDDDSGDEDFSDASATPTSATPQPDVQCAYAAAQAGPTAAPPLVQPTPLQPNFLNLSANTSSDTEDAAADAAAAAAAAAAAGAGMTAAGVEGGRRLPHHPVDHAIALEHRLLELQQQGAPPPPLQQQPQQQLQQEQPLLGWSLDAFQHYEAQQQQLQQQQLDAQAMLAAMDDFEDCVPLMSDVSVSSAVSAADIARALDAMSAPALSPSASLTTPSVALPGQHTDDGAAMMQQAAPLMGQEILSRYESLQAAPPLPLHAQPPLGVDLVSSPMQRCGSEGYAAAAAAAVAAAAVPAPFHAVAAAAPPAADEPCFSYMAALTAAPSATSLSECDLMQWNSAGSIDHEAYAAAVAAFELPLDGLDPMLSRDSSSGSSGSGA